MSTRMLCWLAIRVGGTCCLAGISESALAQGTIKLPEVTVYSTRVANQSSATAFAMPVSALRFEPRVDIHGRNMAEAQADVTIRGGIFENTAFQLGALTISDPQTGHYFAELPVSPAMLGAPRVVTGADLALGATNATAGAIAYAWRPISSSGAATLALGEDGLRRAEFYQGRSVLPAGGGRRFGFDVGVARSRSKGAVQHGDHDFSRTSVRLQSATATAQTDFMAGYQEKHFGWPNLYTPFNSFEQENLQTVLWVLNHRVESGTGESWEAGLFHRRNKDDYAFNRFAPLAQIHPFQHTTWLSGAALRARRDLGALALELKGELLADEIESTSLTSGRYRSRTLTKGVLAAQRAFASEDGTRLTVKAGILGEDSNRDAGTISPLLEIAREFPSAALKRIYASLARSSQVPTYTALNSSAVAGLFRGNPNLGRSTSRNLEVGASGSLAGWLVETAAFARVDRGLVDWTFRNGVVARTANAVDIEVAGLEFVARRNWPGCDLVVGYTWLGKGADYRGAAVDASFYALNYARHRLTAACTWRLGNGVELRLDNAVRWQAPNLLRVRGGDQALVSAVGVAYRPPAVPRVELTARVDNAWNDLFQEVPSVPASPRQFSAAVGYVW